MKMDDLILRGFQKNNGRFDILGIGMTLAQTAYQFERAKSVKTATIEPSDHMRALAFKLLHKCQVKLVRGGASFRVFPWWTE
jgi:pimeloyl-CoA synthetase